MIVTAETSEPDKKLVVRNLYKIFGKHPEEARKLLAGGSSKDEIYRRTGHVIGVDDASFTVREGEVFVVMGLSGSGKSTLVRMLNRLIEPTDGTIEIDGRDVASMNREKLIQLRRKDVGMVFQSFALMPHLTVLENAAFGLNVAGVDAAEQKSRALDALEKVGLAANANARPDELSGGMQQRVGLARALAQNPSILLMDEAFSALDPLIRTEMQDELLRLQQEVTRTVIFISHDLDEAMRIGDRIAIMEAGRIVQVGTPDEILLHPANDYVRSFFRGVDVSQVFTAGDIATRKGLTLIRRPGDGVAAALERLERNDDFWGYVHDRTGTFQGVVSVDSLRAAKDRADAKFEDAFVPDIEAVTASTPLNELLTRAAGAPCPLPVVADDTRQYLGVISKARLLRTIDKRG
ncbi:MAG: glycine betaine/L-proline ABC transporter ATP-binding protein ProV [Alphaproteobacteria bacterium]|jgi:glycine betaine/proline transport system ATP-binding protein|nr:glycine betaine/L-proline ABC transporter ATP-binding protein ProV [Alphaproteobacteria bacterium]